MVGRIVYSYNSKHCGFFEDTDVWRPRALFLHFPKDRNRAELFRTTTPRNLYLDNDGDIIRFADGLKKDPDFGALAQMMKQEFSALPYVLTAAFPDLSPPQTPTQAPDHAVTTDQPSYATVAAWPTMQTPAAPSNQFPPLRLRHAPPPAGTEDRALDIRLTRRARTSIATTTRKLCAPKHAALSNSPRV